MEVKVRAPIAPVMLAMLGLALLMVAVGVSGLSSERLFSVADHALISRALTIKRSSNGLITNVSLATKPKTKPTSEVRMASLVNASVQDNILTTEANNLAGTYKPLTRIK